MSARLAPFGTPLQSRHVSRPPHTPQRSSFAGPPHAPLQSSRQPLLTSASQRPHLSTLCGPLATPAQSAQAFVPWHLPQASTCAVPSTTPAQSLAPLGTVGRMVGAALGLAVGLAVGLALGAALGLGVGLAEGLHVCPAAVGFRVVGAAVVGDVVGTFVVGLAVGATVGPAVGLSVGPEVGFAVVQEQSSPYDWQVLSGVPLLTQLPQPALQVGDRVGCTVGRLVGALGLAVGAAEGPALGTRVGLAEGLAEGRYVAPVCVGARVGLAVSMFAHMKPGLYCERLFHEYESMGTLHSALFCPALLPVYEHRPPHFLAMALQPLGK